jgi:hypothetical protein
VGVNAVKAFLVSVNKQRVALAGIGDNGSMSAVVQWIGGTGLEGVALRNQLRLILGGLDTATREHVRWDVPEIAVGDEIVIKVVESDSIDPESSRYVASERNE